ncbi:hypothetical protein Dimus_003628, partial [Dionaea muscipula]
HEAASICWQQGGQQHEVQRPAAEWRVALDVLQPAIESKSRGVQPVARGCGKRTIAVREVSSSRGQRPPRDQRPPCDQRSGAGSGQGGVRPAGYLAGRWGVASVPRGQ